MDFHTADPRQVLEGKVTDVYFERTAQVLRACGVDRHVRAEFAVKELAERSWGVCCGIEDVVAMVETLGLRVDVRAVPEGTVFRAGMPVLEIAGRYLEFGRYETAFLGLLCQASGVASRAAAARLAAEGRPVVCFGARRVHPVIAPAMERYAYLGGAEGVAAMLSAEKLGIAPVGTMPHALVLQLGDTVQAARAFDRTIAEDVPRVVLVDTFQDERFEALRVAEALGDRLAGVRLDTPASRRGDFLELLREVRWELDLRGYRHVKLFVSGGLGVREILRLNPVADAYGIGTYLTAAPPADFSMDLVEVEGKPLAKRGKRSGAKSVWRCEACARDVVLALGTAPGSCPCGGRLRELLEAFVQDGRRVRSAEPVETIRARVLEQLASGHFSHEVSPA